MACSSINGEFPDIWDWISALPDTSDWQKDDKSLNLCNGLQVSLLFSAIKKPGSRASEVTFSLLADFQFSIPLWTSEPRKLHPKEKAMYNLFLNFIEGILFYGSQKQLPGSIESQVELQEVMRSNHSKGMFKCAFLAMALCVCYYEAPGDIRSCCVEAIERELEKEVKNRDYWKAVLEVVGSKIEEQVMRSMALLITNRTFLASKDPESFAWDKSVGKRIHSPYSYSASTKGLWKIRVYTPVLAMRAVDKHSSYKDDGLAVALSYLHVEAVLQLSYVLDFKPEWIEVRVKVDNIRCDVIPLISEDSMEESGLSEEKHFPSRVSIELAPENESKLLAVSLNMSSANPSVEMTNERTMETGFEPPSSFAVLKLSGTQGSTVSIKAWKMEQSVKGSQGIFDWALYDTVTVKQVAYSRPSKMEWMQSKAWFRDRYSSALSPFTRQGGVVFARDEYSEDICWKVKTDMEGKIMRWEVGGSICVTYWPNKYRTFFCETRCLRFSEPLELPLIRSGQ